MPIKTYERGFVLSFYYGMECNIFTTYIDKPTSFSVKQNNFFLHSDYSYRYAIKIVGITLYTH